MPIEHIKNTINASAGYAALRHGGASPSKAAIELRMDPELAQCVERRFQARRAGTPDDPMKPRYARNGRHVADVLARGGFPALPDKPR